MIGTGVPITLRPARFIRRECSNQRKPMRLPAGVFTAAGVELPAERSRWNDHALTEGRGHQWSPAIDNHVRRCGADLVMGGLFAALDLDADDRGTGLDWLVNYAAGHGHEFTLTGTVVVRTPGWRHEPGYHVWYALARPVREGALRQCPLVEVKTSRLTCPGSPGYEVVRDVADLPPLPPWLAVLAGPPEPARVPSPQGERQVNGRPGARLEGLARVLEMTADRRTTVAYGIARRLAEDLIARRELDADTVMLRLFDAMVSNGAVAKWGPQECRGAIRRGISAGLRGGSAGAA